MPHRPRQDTLTTPPNLPTFTADAAAGLGGPAWLAERRAAAAARVADMALPTTEEEVWRYSRVDELDLDAFAPVANDAAGAGATVPVGAAAILALVPERAGAVVVRNGCIVHTELAPEWADRGVHLGAASGAVDPASAIGAVTGEPTDLFAALNDAFVADPVVLQVPAGVAVTAPIVVVDWVVSPSEGPDVAGSGRAPAPAVFPRLVVLAGEDSDVRILDWHGSDDVVALVAPVIELAAARAARVRYLNVQDRGPRIWQIASQVSRADADATVSATQAALGGDYARTRADCRLDGRGASGNLQAIYFGERHQMLDFRTFQDHAAPDTTSNLLFKGAVGGYSQSVYTGLIRVRKNARGTNAFQTNRNIKLSDHAWAESVPNLEIENNDVHCSHASAVGPVDEDQRFYVESRGVPPAVAERLIVSGFFAEVLAQLPVPEVAPALRARIDDRLDRRDDADELAGGTSGAPVGGGV